MGKYNWKLKAVGEENQGMLPNKLLGYEVYGYVKGTIKKSLEDYKKSLDIDYREKVFGVNYSKEWKITWPFRYLKKKLVGWGLKKGLDQGAKAAQEIINGEYGYYNGDYVMNQLKEHNTGVSFNGALAKDLYKATGYKLDTDVILQEIQNEICGDPKASFYASEWRKTVMPGIIKSLYERYAKKVVQSVTTEFELAGKKTGEYLSDANMRMAMTNGLFLLGQVFEQFSVAIAENTDILDIPPSIFETKIDDSDIPERMSLEGRAKITGMSRPGLTSPESIEKMINPVIQKYSDIHKKTVYKPTIKGLDLAQTLGLKEYKEAKVGFIGQGVNILKDYGNYFIDSVVPTIQTVANTAPKVMGEVNGIVSAYGSEYLERIGNYFSNDKTKTWQKKVLGDYNRSYVNKKARDYATGRVTQTVAEWKKYNNNEERKTKLFGNEYGEKHWAITAPLRYLGKKLFEWGINKGYDIGEKTLNDLIRGENRWMEGQDVFNALLPFEHPELKFDENLAIDLYNVSGYEFDGNSLIGDIGEEIASNNTNDIVGFYANDWRTKVIPGMLKTLFEREQKKLFDSVMAKFNEHPEIKNKDLLNETLRRANEKLGAIFENYAEKLAENTDLLDVPPRFLANKNKDIEEIPQDLTEEQKLILKTKGLRPGLTTQNAIDKAVKSYTKSLKVEKNAIITTMSEEKLRESLGIQKREHIAEKGIVEKAIDTVYEIGNQVVENTKELASVGIEAAKEGMNYVYEKVGEGAEYVAKKVNESAEYVAEKVNEGVDYVAEKVSEGVDYVAEKVSEGVDYVADTINSGVETVKNSVVYSKDFVVNQFNKAYENTKNVVYGTGKLVYDYGKFTYQGLSNMMSFGQKYASRLIYGNPEEPKAEKKPEEENLSEVSKEEGKLEKIEEAPLPDEDDGLVYYEAAETLDELDELNEVNEVNNKEVIIDDNGEVFYEMEEDEDEEEFEEPEVKEEQKEASEEFEEFEDFEEAEEEKKEPEEVFEEAEETKEKEEQKNEELPPEELGTEYNMVESKKIDEVMVVDENGDPDMLFVKRKPAVERIDERIKDIATELANTPKGEGYREKAVIAVAKMTVLFSAKEICLRPENQGKEPSHIDKLLDDRYLGKEGIKKTLDSQVFKKMIDCLHDNDIGDLAGHSDMVDFHKDYVTESRKAKKAEKSIQDAKAAETKLDAPEKKDVANKKAEEPKQEKLSWREWFFGK